MFKHTNFIVDWSLGITNLNKNGVPEVFDYQLPKSILSLPKRAPSKIQRKLVHILLRRSSSRKLYPKKSIMWIISTPLRFLLFNYLGVFAKILFPASLDADSVRSKEGRSEYLIGFFHSNRWVSSPSSKQLLEDLEPKVIEPYVTKLQKMAEIKKPIVLHMRLGDYEKEEKFGLLPTRYYSEGLELLKNLGFSGEIWIFTNDLEKAKTIFPSSFESRAVWIPDFSESSVQVLEAMRLGSAYVIGNSTFSWWAASLARDKAARVVAPNPWFRSAATHHGLLPTNWLTIDPW